MELDWLRPAAFFGSILYALIGVLIFWLCFVLIDKITPHDLWREIVEKQTAPWAWWWQRCVWASASSSRRQSTAGVERAGQRCRNGFSSSNLINPMKAR